MSTASTDGSFNRLIVVGITSISSEGDSLFFRDGSSNVGYRYDFRSFVFSITYRMKNLKCYRYQSSRFQFFSLIHLTFYCSIRISEAARLISEMASVFSKNQDWSLERCNLLHELQAELGSFRRVAVKDIFEVVHRLVLGREITFVSDIA